MIQTLTHPTLYQPLYLFGPALLLDLAGSDTPVVPRYVYADALDMPTLFHRGLDLPTLRSDALDKPTIFLKGLDS